MCDLIERLDHHRASLIEPEVQIIQRPVGDAFDSVLIRVAGKMNVFEKGVFFPETLFGTEPRFAFRVALCALFKFGVYSGRGQQEVGLGAFSIVEILGNLQFE